MPKQEPKALDRIMVSLHLKKEQGGGLTREQAMAAWPVRNPSLKTQEDDNGLVVVHLPRRKDWVGSALSFLFFVPESKPVQLDEVGSFVWRLCDGEHTVNEIVAAMTEEYKLNRREVEVSLTEYLQKLGKRGMIGFAVPRDVAEAAGMKGVAAYPPGPIEKEPAAPAESSE